MKTNPFTTGKQLSINDLKTACAYWRCGMQQHEAVFYLSFQQVPSMEDFWVACGLKQVIDHLTKFGFPRDELMYFSSLVGSDGEPIFDPGFLEYLLKMEFSCTLHAVPEGTIVFAHEPLLRVEGPLIQCQLLKVSTYRPHVAIQTAAASHAARLSTWPSETNCWLRILRNL